MALTQEGKEAIGRYIMIAVYASIFWIFYATEGINSVIIISAAIIIANQIFPYKS